MANMRKLTRHDNARAYFTAYYAMQVTDKYFVSSLQLNVICDK